MDRTPVHHFLMMSWPFDTEWSPFGMVWLCAWKPICSGVRIRIGEPIR